MTDPDLSPEAARAQDEALYPHKRIWRLKSEFRPLLWAYSHVWKRQAGLADVSRGGSPMEALEEAEDPIFAKIAEIDAERDRLRAALTASQARAERAEAEVRAWGQLTQQTSLEAVIAQAREEAIREAAAIAAPPLAHRTGKPGAWRQLRARIAEDILALLNAEGGEG